MEISGAVLAGGLSTRFPTDKTQLCIEGENIVVHIVRLLRGFFEDVFVVSNQKKRIQGFEEDCIIDLYEKTGPLGAIYTALSFARTEWIFALAGDMPFMNSSYLAWAISQIEEEDDAVIPKDNKGYQPLCAFYKKSCMKSIERNLQARNYKITKICSEVHCKYLDIYSFPGIQKNPYLFYNINTKEDWENYLLFKEH